MKHFRRIATIACLFAAWVVAMPALAVDDLSLNVAAGSESVSPGDTVTVTLDVANLSEAINGVQALIFYDDALLTLDSIVAEDLGLIPPDAGWVEVAFADNAGDVTYAAVINGDSTLADGPVATLTFTAIAEGVTTIVFRPDANPFFTKLTAAADNATLLPTKSDSGPINSSCDDGNPCTTDSVVGGFCDYTPAPSGTLCRAATDVCDVEETCDGVNTSCPLDAVEPSTTVCRASTGECDLEETCDGAGTACPLDSFVASGTQCADSTPGDCDDAQCDGAGACDQLFGVEDGSYVCRGAVDVCDIDEFCDGISGGACPIDAVEPSTTVCRASTGECDLEETCDGAGTACPLDSFVASGTQCTDSTPDDCDDAQCDGAGACDQLFDVEASGYVCRGAVDVCDIEEACDGVSGGACPVDAVEPSTTVCRASTGECDLEETCDGAGTACPLDSFVASGIACTDTTPGDCDDAQCDGAGACDQLFDVEASGYVCRGAVDVCDIDEFCDGISGGACPIDAVEPSTTVCRASTGECDLEETCDGAGTACPLDSFVASGTQCTDLTPDDCDDAQCDGAGACDQLFDVEASGYVCRGAVDVCDIEEACDGVSGGACPVDAVEPSTTVCRASTGLCDPEETCDGVSGFCPADAFEPNGTSCDDGTFCNGQETCDGAGTCQPSSDPCAPLVCDEANDICLAPVHISNLEVFYAGKYLNAPDPSRVFLAAGSVAELSNITNYAFGITGIRVTFDNLVTFATTPGAAFSFEWTTATGTTFTPIDNPGGTVTVTASDGGGFTIVDIVITNNHVRQRWLKVTVDSAQITVSGSALDGELFGNPIAFPSGDGNAGGNAIFYLGNMPGEVTGDRKDNLTDVGQIRLRVNPALLVPIDNIYDIDKSEKVQLGDVGRARLDVNPAFALPLIAP